MTSQSLETAPAIEAAPVEAAMAAPRRRRNPQLAVALSVVPGLGHVYTLQWKRAAFFLLSTLLTMGPAILLITAGERFGTTLIDRRQFTAFLLVAFGSIIVFLALFLLGLAFWASAVIDARRSAVELSEGRSTGGRWWFFRL